jgi:hypothetical protein
MFELKSCQLTKAPEHLAPREDLYHARYDLKHNNGKTTLTAEMDVYISEHDGRVLDAKLVVEGLQCEGMEQLREKLGDWLSRLSIGALEPVKIQNFVPSYSKDWAKAEE